MSAVTFGWLMIHRPEKGEAYPCCVAETKESAVEWLKDKTDNEATEYYYDGVNYLFVGPAPYWAEEIAILSPRNE